MNWGADPGPLLFLMKETRVQPRHGDSDYNSCNRSTNETGTTMLDVERVVRNSVSSLGHALHLPF
jgi:hypothetical protein